MDRIYAGIISYNPDVDRLRKNIDSISQQVSAVVVFENGSTQQRYIVEEFPSVLFLRADRNIGIAGALNQLLRWGKNNDYEWMISLDQDSVCPDGYVENMQRYLQVSMKIGIVAPVIIDRNIGIVGHRPQRQWEEVRTCITSGAFNSIEAWSAVSGYDESMFIDSVDFEYCYRLRKLGYKVIQIRKAQLLHEIGKSQKRRFLFWKVKVNGHCAFRKYYIARNNVYYPLKHKLWLRFLRGNFRNLWLLITVVLYEDDKSEKEKAIRQGWKDGMNRKTSAMGSITL
ncbi:MAG: glycosyltransferase family 2 protein [Clostridiales bacterium]|nr:glycosyltransferase family 2 protein [Clostridiales bacterium]